MIDYNTTIKYCKSIIPGKVALNLPKKQQQKNNNKSSY